MTRSARALVIQADGSYEYRDLPIGYPAFNHSFLPEGSYVQALNCPGRIMLWFDEEGKLEHKQLPDNPVATQLYRELGGSPLMPGDRLVGPVVVTGSGGEEIADCPDVSAALQQALEVRR